MRTPGTRKPAAETRVMVAMSGGVDSSVCAALLAEEGFQVVGVTLQLYDHGEAVNRARSCCAGRDIHDARRVAEALGIPHYVLNYETRFREDVMDPFADSYIRGETPIPCVLCNQTVKFRDLVKLAHDIGADELATGHYIRLVNGPGGPELQRAVDARRDQSYFLFATTREQLSWLRFPLGDMPKDEVRSHARRLALPVADKPDSQDICFVPHGDYAAVVRRLRPGAIDPGEITLLDGTVVGTHDGIIGFTVGQRRGLGTGGGGDPLYVVRIEPETRRIVVGPHSALGQSTVNLVDLNWLGSDLSQTEDGLSLTVKLRSTQEPVPARVFPDPAVGRARVVLDQPERAVTPGQACVFYDGDRLLGGGWIARDPDTPAASSNNRPGGTRCATVADSVA